MTRLIPPKSTILLILLFSLILNVTGVWFGLPSYEGWCPDEILPDHVRQGIELRFAHGWNTKYPPLHYYLLALVQGPAMAAAQFLKLDLDDVVVYSAFLLLGRLVSLMMALGIILLVYKSGLEILDRRASIFAALITALLIPFVYYSKTTNLDIPYFFWFTLSLFYFLRLLKTRRRKYYLLFALTAALAIGTKDQAYGLYILPVLYILYRDWKSRKKESPGLTALRFITNPTYVYAAAVALAAFFLIFNLAFNFQGFLLHLKTITGPLSKNAQLFPHTPGGHLRLLGRALDQIRFSLGWPLLAVCAAGLIRAFTSKTRNPLLLSLLSFCISFEIFLIHVVMYNYARFYLPACLILSFFGGQFLASIFKATAKLAILSRAAVAAVFLYSGFYAFSLDLLMVKDSRYAAENWIKENIPADSFIGLGVLPVYGPRIPGFRHFKMDNPFMKLSRLPSPPEYIILTTEWSRRFVPPSDMERRIRQFYLEKEGYKITYRYRTPLSWLPLDNRRVIEQINTINPEVLILKRRDIDPALSENESPGS
jgi:4-amino-4-deoxy-L-arabinose transferase-like glycosyltransferase